MIDACRAFSCTWPSPTQPTLCTLCCSSNPVEPVTPGSGGACCLTRLEWRCSVSSTAGIVCVRFWSSPPLACYRRNWHFAVTILQWLLYPPKYISTLQNSVEPWAQFHHEHQWDHRDGPRWLVGWCRTTGVVKSSPLWKLSDVCMYAVSCVLATGVAWS